MRCADFWTLHSVIMEIQVMEKTEMMSANAIRRKIKTATLKRVKAGQAGPVCHEINGNDVEIIPDIRFRATRWQEEDEDEEYVASTDDDSDVDGNRWENISENKDLRLPEIDLERAEVMRIMGDEEAMSDRGEANENGVGGATTDGEDTDDAVVEEENEDGDKDEDEDEDAKRVWKDERKFILKSAIQRARELPPEAIASEGEEKANQGVNDKKDEEEEDMEGGEINPEDILR